MAYEEVIMRTADGQEYGPATLAQLRQWHTEGRVPMDAMLIDVHTGAVSPVVNLLSLMPPPPVIPPTPTMPSTYYPQQPIPTEDCKEALYALILSLVGLVICPIVCEPLAIYFAITAKKNIASNPSLKGAGMAQAALIIAIIGLCFSVLAFLFWVVLMAIAGRM